MKKETVFGIFFTLLGLIGVLIHIKYNAWRDIFWLSNHWALINGIGFLTKRKKIFSGVLLLGFIPELFWVIDFLFVLSGSHFLGITEYWFHPTYPTILAFLGLQHFVNPIGSLYGLHCLGYAKTAWKYAIVYGLLIWSIGFLFIPEYNINCSWRSCIPKIPDSLWRFLFPLLMIFLIQGQARILMGLRKV